jgi:hypothetical protein
MLWTITSYLASNFLQDRFAALPDATAVFETQPALVAIYIFNFQSRFGCKIPDKFFVVNIPSAMRLKQGIFGPETSSFGPWGLVVYP